MNKKFSKKKMTAKYGSLIALVVFAPVMIANEILFSVMSVQ